jgi:hypothetical protein
MEKIEELVKALRNEVLPILKKQTGFLEILPFFPETKNEKVISITLWAEKKMRSAISVKRLERSMKS